MINLNEELIDQLSDSELKLLLTFMRWGKKSRPDLKTLKYRTRWGVEKIQKYKKLLIKKNLLIVQKRFKTVEGKLYRDSNEYIVNSDLISKYNGLKTELPDFQVVQLKANSELLDFQVVEFQVDEFQVIENQTGNKVLKSLIIESNKLLEFFNLKKENEQLKKRIKELESGLKEQNSEKEKSCAKKEKGTHVFPDLTGGKKYNPKDKRVNKNLPFSSIPSDARNTLLALYPADNEELKNDCILMLGQTLSDSQLNHARVSFIQSLQNYDQLRYIRDVRLFKEKFVSWWIPRDIKYQKNAPTNNTSKSTDNLSYDASTDDLLRQQYG